MKRLIMCVFVWAVGLCCVSNSNAQTLSVGLMDVDRPPYFWKDGAGRYQGLFIELFETLSEESGIYFSYQSLPQARIRLYMLAGRLDIEPGVAPKWRRKKGEEDVSVYTDPFMMIEQVYVVSGMKNIEKPRRSDLEGFKFCNVLGFSKPARDGKGDVQELLSESQLLGMLDKGRCDYATLPHDVLNYLQRTGTYSVTHSEPFIRFALRLRLHKRHKNLVPVLNEALNKMKQDGRLAKILEDYQYMY